MKKQLEEKLYNSLSSKQKRHMLENIPSYTLGECKRCTQTDLEKHLLFDSSTSFKSPTLD